MSTILGIFARDGRPVTAADLASMARLVAHQGPDGARQWRAGPAGLQLLALHETPECAWDLQPAALDPRIDASAPADVVICADCRIDNRTELAVALAIPPALLAQLPDSQLILAAYLRWGADCPRHLLGDFAFAVWDGPQRTFFCARDPLGIKPFYYHLRADLFLFASDVRGVVAHPAAPRRADGASLARHLRDFAFVDATATYLAEVVKLPPAHTLRVTERRTELDRYWRPEQIQPLRLPTPDDYVQQARLLLEDAVAQRIRTAHRVGAHLSGGLDSSSIAVLAGRWLRQRGYRLPTYNWQPTPGPDDDTSTMEYASLRQVCAAEDFTHTNVDLTPDNLLLQLRQDICLHHALDLWYEPLVRQAARADGVRVLLSGWGGDELLSFNGRGWHAEQFWQGHWRTLARTFWKGPTLLRRGRRLASGLYHKVLLPSLPDVLYHRLFTRREATVYTGCATAGFAATIAALPPAAPARMRASVHATQLSLLQYGHLTKRAEVWANAGADDGIVYRFPLLDRRLVELCLSVPATLFFDGDVDRILYRRTVDGVLPPSLQWGQVKDEPARIQNLIAEMAAALEQLDAPAADHAYCVSKRIDMSCLTRLLQNAPPGDKRVAQQMQAVKSFQVLSAGADLALLG